MTLLGRYLTISIIMFFVNHRTYAQWEQMTTPYGSGRVNCFTVKGTNIFAGTNGGGIFLSTNDGTSWTNVNNGLTNQTIWALIVSEDNIFAGTYGGGVFRSTNNGANWSAVNSGLTDTDIWALATYGSNLFSGTSGGVFLSTNNGTGWSAVNNGLTDIDINVLAVSGTNLYAGTFSGVFLTTDSGANWNEVNTGLTDLTIWTLAASGTNLFAGTETDGVFLTTDNGTSWNAVNYGLTDFNINALTVCGNNLFTGTYGSGVFFTAAADTSWSTINSGLTDLNVISLADNGTDLLAGTDDGYVFLLPDASTLPVELTSFTATMITDGVSLRWVTATEVNTARFDIERRSVGTSIWTKIGSVNGAGVSNAPRSYSYLDKAISDGRYVYNLIEVDNDGTMKAIGSAEVEVGLTPKKYALGNYPNPFNPSTIIYYDLPIGGNMTLKIFDVLGREVITLVSEVKQPGSHKIEFRGNGIPSGIYFCRLMTDRHTEIRKMMLIK